MSVRTCGWTCCWVPPFLSWKPSSHHSRHLWRASCVPAPAPVLVMSAGGTGSPAVKGEGYIRVLERQGAGGANPQPSSPRPASPLAFKGPPQALSSFWKERRRGSAAPSPLGRGCELCHHLDHLCWVGNRGTISQYCCFFISQGVLPHDPRCQ
jgi:hypothetical protein